MRCRSPSGKTVTDLSKLLILWRLIGIGRSLTFDSLASEKAMVLSRLSPNDRTEERLWRVLQLA